MCSSGNQAQIAASMASTEAQAEAARNALAFTKEQFEYMKGLRKPYTDAGASATTMLMNLLGLQLPNYNPPGGSPPPINPPGGGGPPGTNPGTSPSTGGGPGSPSGPGGPGGPGRPGTFPGTSTGVYPGSPSSAFPGQKFPGYVAPTFKVGDVGFEKPVPGIRPVIDPATGQQYIPEDEPWRRGEGTPPDSATDTSGIPPWSPTPHIPNTTVPATDTVQVTRGGQTITVPASILAWYLNMGYTKV